MSTPDKPTQPPPGRSGISPGWPEANYDHPDLPRPQGYQTPGQSYTELHTAIANHADRILGELDDLTTRLRAAVERLEGAEPVEAELVGRARFDPVDAALGVLDRGHELILAGLGRATSWLR